MTNGFKVLVAFNIVTVALAGGALYFSYKAMNEASSANFAAEWGSRNAAMAFDEVKQTLSKIEEVTGGLAARADLEDRLNLPPQYRK